MQYNYRKFESKFPLLNVEQYFNLMQNNRTSTYTHTEFHAFELPNEQMNIATENSLQNVSSLSTRSY